MDNIRRGYAACYKKAEISGDRHGSIHGLCLYMMRVQTKKKQYLDSISLQISYSSLSLYSSQSSLPTPIFNPQVKRYSYNGNNNHPCYTTIFYLQKGTTGYLGPFYNTHSRTTTMSQAIHDEEAVLRLKELSAWAFSCIQMEMEMENLFRCVDDDRHAKAHPFLSQVGLNRIHVSGYPNGVGRAWRLTNSRDFATRYVELPGESPFRSPLATGPYSSLCRLEQGVAV